MPDRRLLVAVCLLSVLFASCFRTSLGNPSEDEVAAGQALPLDGYAEILPNAWGSSPAKVRIDHGRVIAVDGDVFVPGTVLITDLRQVDETRYVGSRLFAGQKFDTNLRLISKTEIVETIDLWTASDTRWTLASCNNPEAFAVAHPHLPLWHAPANSKPLSEHLLKWGRDAVVIMQSLDFLYEEVLPLALLLIG